MDGRKDFFRKFVRNLDQQAPYEDRKALALKTLRSQYGQESSLLASEDRLLRGILQHRAGRNVRKRPPVLPSGPIDLLDVKEEEVHLGRRVRTTFGSVKSLADR